MFEATDGSMSRTAKTEFKRRAKTVPLVELRPDELEFSLKKSQVNPCNKAKPKFTQGKINHSQKNNTKK